MTLSIVDSDDEIHLWTELNFEDCPAVMLILGCWI